MFPLPLTVSVGHSRYLRIALALAHLAGASAIYLAAVPPMAQWAGLIGLFISLGYYSRPASHFRLRGNQDGRLDIWQHGQWQQAHIASSSVIWSNCLLMRLGFVDQPRYHNLVVMPDSMTASDFRRLLVWVRWRAKSDMEAPPLANDTPVQ